MKVQRAGTSLGLLFGLLCVAGVGAPPAQAQQGGRKPAVEEHQFLEEARWGKLTDRSEVGKRYYLEGRWKEAFGSLVTVLPAELSRGFLTVTQGTPLQGELSKSAPSVPGGILQKNISTVRVFGTVQQGPDNKLVLVISKVVKLEDDMARFMTEANALAADDADGRARLAADARAIAERYRDPQLKELADQLDAQALAILCKQLAPGDHAGALALAAQMRAAGNRRGAIGLLGGVAQATTASEPQRQEARRVLGELEAILDHGQWVPFEEFKVNEGFIRRGTAWIRKEQAELDDERAKFMAMAANVGVVSLRTNPMQSGRDADQKKLSVGQFMEEAREAGRDALPVVARHVQAQDENGKTVDWAQWIFTDGRRAYFRQEGDAPSVLFACKAASDPYPDK